MGSQGSRKAAAGGREKRPAPSRASWPGPVLPQCPPRGPAPTPGPEPPGTRAQGPATAARPDPPAWAAGVGGHVQPRVRARPCRASPARGPPLLPAPEEDRRRQWAGVGGGSGLGDQSGARAHPCHPPPRPAPPAPISGARRRPSWRRLCCLVELS